MTDLHTRIANRCNAQGIRTALITGLLWAFVLVFAVLDWPGDRLSARKKLNNTPHDLGEGQGKGFGLGHVVQRNNSNREF